MAATVRDFCDYLEKLAPSELAEEWDNVGLLVGDPATPVQRVMTCLTLTQATVAEAVREQAQLVVAHHPLPFKPLKRITSETTVGALLLDLIRAGTAVASAHTACDSAADGINQRLAERLGLVEIEPLIAHSIDPKVGTGRRGRLGQPESLQAVAARVKQALSISQLHVVGPLERQVATLAIGCGSAGSLLGEARGCDAFLTGETNLHTCYEAESNGVGLILAGHYATERFYMEHLAEQLSVAFPDTVAWASRDERDPLQLL
jgi:dinuclear metal center YbgI/SA1388 family protein